MYILLVSTFEVITMPTTIASWGNSEAVRLPKEQLRLVGLGKGDIVDFIVNERGHLEIVPEQTFRQGQRRRKVSFDELFKDFEVVNTPREDPWGDDGFVGDEEKAWL